MRKKKGSGEGEGELRERYLQKVKRKTFWGNTLTCRRDLLSLKRGLEERERVQKPEKENHRNTYQKERANPQFPKTVDQEEENFLGKESRAKNCIC